MNNKLNKNIKEKTFTLDIVAKYLFLISLFTKPFYTGASGFAQFSDVCMVLSFVVFLLCKGFKFKFDKKDVFLVIFLMCVIVINLVVFLVETDEFLVRSIEFYIYNFIAVLLFRGLIENKYFINQCVWVLRLTIFVQFVMYLTGSGADLSGVRYVGTFNDPNQLAFFMFMCVTFIQVCLKKTKMKPIYIDDVCVIVLTVISASIGMLAALFIHYCIRIVAWKYNNIVFKTFVLLTLCCSLCFVMPAIDSFLSDGEKTENSYVNWLKTHYVEKKQKSESSSGMDGFIKDRNLFAIIEHPECLVIGSGEGAFYRFASKNHLPGELHSTIFSIWFSYGLIPFIILCIWVIKNLKPSFRHNYELLFYLPVLIECFTLANQRQPLLWILIALASYRTFIPDKSNERV